MLTIALTGGIGSGKTAVSNCFQELARQYKNPDCLSIIDADTIARNLLSGSLHKSPSDALIAVQNLFGGSLFNSSGQLDRSHLRSLIFSSELKKKQLNELLHPLVYKEIFAKITELSQQSETEIIIISIPLLFETKTENRFDRILVIDIPVELQITRSTQRDQCSKKLIKQIIASQVTRQTRLNHAHDIIDNSGTLAELQEKVAQIFQYYCSLAVNEQAK